jgi:hypothetical protein
MLCIQGLSNEKVQTIVRSKGERALLSECIDSAMEEESAILSAKERGFAGPRTNYRNGFRGHDRGLIHPGRRVDVSNNGVRNANIVTGSICKEIQVGKIRCYACGAMGHISRDCRNKDKSAWRQTDSSAENGKRVQLSSQTGHPSRRYYAALKKGPQH